MRPIRVTGVTGTSPPVPLDVYSISTAAVALETAAAGAQMQYTVDNVFDLTLTLVWFNLGAVAASVPLVAQAPIGARAIRCTGMIPADVLVVSQQSIT